jgi:hypothetical protein
MCMQLPQLDPVAFIHRTAGDPRGCVQGAAQAQHVLDGGGQHVHPRPRGEQAEAA